MLAESSGDSLKDDKRIWGIKCVCFELLMTDKDKWQPLDSVAAPVQDENAGASVKSGLKA